MAKNKVLHERNWTDSRKCLQCKEFFTPKRPQDWNSDFCQENHRKLYWKHGTLKMDKLRSELEGVSLRHYRLLSTELTAKVEDLEKRLTRVEKSCGGKKVLDGKANEVVTLEP
jgi:transposase InsO family protein